MANGWLKREQNWINARSTAGSHYRNDPDCRRSALIWRKLRKYHA